MRISSTVTFYRVQLPNYFKEKIFECPIEYMMKKHNLDNNLPIPCPKRLANGDYIVAFPESSACHICDILTSEEDCIFTVIQTRDYAIENLEDTFVGENFITVDCVNRVNYFLSKRIPLA